MDAEVVFSGGNDGGKSGTVRAELRQRIIKIRFVLVLIFSGAGSVHHGQNARLGDLLGFTQRLNLAGLLYKPQPADQHVGVFQTQERIFPLDHVSPAVRRAVNVSGGDAVEVEIHGSVVSAVRQRGKIRFQRADEAHVLNTGNAFRFLRLDPSAGPALGNSVRRQQIQPLRDTALGVLQREQHRLPALQPRKVDKAPIREKRVIFVVRFPDLIAGKKHQKRTRLHHGIEPIPVSLIVCGIHGLFLLIQTFLL